MNIERSDAPRQHLEKTPQEMVAEAVELRKQVDARIEELKTHSDVSKQDQQPFRLTQSQTLKDKITRGTQCAGQFSELGIMPYGAGTVEELTDEQRKDVQACINAAKSFLSEA